MGKIKANLDSSYMIEEDARYVYHVAVERRTLPKGAMEFISTKWVVPFHTKMEFEQFQKYPKAAGINGAHSLIHDPVKQIADEKDGKVALDIKNQVITDRYVELYDADPPGDWTIDHIKEGIKKKEEEMRIIKEGEEKNLTPKETDKSLEDELLGTSLKDLRELYPDIKATSVKDFIEKIKGTTA